MNGKRDKELKQKIMEQMYSKQEIATHRKEILKSMHFKKVLKAARQQYHQNR